jgi:hypothetical protein
MLAQPNLPTPLLVTEKSARVAKVAPADVRKAEHDALYAQLGRCMDEVRCVFGLNLEQFADALGKDQRQVARQLLGTERPQLESVFAVERFQGPLVVSLARLANGVEVDTVIRVRRTA